MAPAFRNSRALARSPDPSAEVQLHTLLASARKVRERLTVVGTDEPKPLIKADGGIVPIEHPEEGGPDAGSPKLVKYDSEHKGSDTRTAAFRGYPNVFQVTLVLWCIWLPSYAEQADRLAFAETDTPAAPVEFGAPAIFPERFFPGIRGEECPRRFTQSCQPDISQRKPLIAGEPLDIQHKRGFLHRIVDAGKLSLLSFTGMDLVPQTKVLSRQSTQVNFAAGGFSGASGASAGRA